MKTGYAGVRVAALQPVLICARIFLVSLVALIIFPDLRWPAYVTPGAAVAGMIYLLNYMHVCAWTRAAEHGKGL